MKNEEAVNIIREVLKQMGAIDIEFPDTKKSNLITVVFNCKEVTSFVSDVPGWNYSGIQLNTTGGHQYKIDFTKIS